MASAQFFPIAASWLLTYLVHSSLLLVGAWLVTDRRAIRSMVVRDTVWKVALVGGICTASLQVGFGFEPFSGQFQVVASQAIPADQSEIPLDAPSQTPLVEPEDDFAGASVGPARSGPEASNQSDSGDRGASVPTTPAFGAFDRVLALLGGIGWLSAILLLWVVGAVVGLGRFAYARAKVWRLLSDRREVHDPDLLNMVQTLRRVAGFRHEVRLTWSRTITTPVAFRSEICLPKQALIELSREHHRGILAHEIAHIARRDPTWLAVGMLVHRVLFFQPLNGLARRNLREVAEYLCDDWAVTHTGTKLTFAESLAEVATWISRAQRPALLSTMAEDGSQLVRRVERILDSGNSPTAWAPHRLRVPGAALVLLAIGGIAPGVSYQGAQRSETPAEPAVAMTIPLMPDTVAQEIAIDPASEIPPNTRPTDTVLAPDTTAGATDAPPEAADEAAVPDRAQGGSTPPNVSQAALRSTSAPWPDATPDDSEQQSADTVVVNSLIRALADEDANVRSEAANALGRLASPLAVPALIGALRDDNADVRYRAAAALARIPDSRSVEPLGAALSDPSPRVRQYVASALGRNSDPRVPALIAQALGDENVGVRRTAVRAIGRLKSVESVGPLTTALNDTDDEVREYAIRALGEIEDRRSVAPIIDALRDDSADVREAAVRALGELKDPRAVDPLIQVLNDASPNVREHAIRSLRSLADPRAVQPIIQRLQDENSDVREYAVRALANWGDAIALTPIIGRLQDPSPDVREAAANALDEFKDPRVVPPLIEALTDSTVDVREAAIRSLTSLEDPRGVTPIIDRLRDPDPGIRTVAARALHAFEDPRVYTPLIETLNDSSANVRIGALHSLEELEDARAVEPTIRMLSDDSPNVRQAAARVLAELKDPSSVGPLLELASDSVPEVRGAALRAVTAMRDPRAVPAVITALQDPSPRLRRSAAGWLGYLKDPRGIDPLIAALRDEDSRVRAAAARALAELGNR